MNSILAARPLSTAGHLLSGTIETLKSELRNVWLGLCNGKAEVLEPSTVAFCLPDAIDFLKASVDGQFPDRLLLLQTRSSHTALWNNAWRSRGWFEMAFPINKAVQIEDTYYLSEPKTITKGGGEVRGQWGAFQFIRVAGGEITRSVSLVNDGGRWVYTTVGVPVPADEQDEHIIAKKSQQFTQEMLERCLAREGMFPFDDNYFVVDKLHPAIGIRLDVSDELRERFFPQISFDSLREKYGPFE